MIEEYTDIRGMKTVVHTHELTIEQMIEEMQTVDICVFNGTWYARYPHYDEYTEFAGHGDTPQAAIRALHTQWKATNKVGVMRTPGQSERPPRSDR